MKKKDILLLDSYFINGDELPPKLSNKETKELFQLLSKGSEEAREKLIVHNIRLVLYQISNKFSNVIYDKKDLISIGNIGLLNAIDTFDVTKNYEFSTYACKCIDNEIFRFLRKNNKDKNVDSLEDAVCYDKDHNSQKLEEVLFEESDFIEDLVQKDVINILDKIVDGLPEREREIIKMRFGFYNDIVFTQDQISEKMHISQPQISRIVSKTVKYLEDILYKQRLIELHEPINNNDFVKSKLLKK